VSEVECDDENEYAYIVDERRNVNLIKNFLFIMIKGIYLSTFPNFQLVLSRDKSQIFILYY